MVYLLTTDDILGNAGLKDVTKGVRSVLADFFFFRLNSCVTWNFIHSKRDSVRKAREAHLINKAKTLHPFGINKRDEARQ